MGIPWARWLEGFFREVASETLEKAETMMQRKSFGVERDDQESRSQDENELGMRPEREVAGDEIRERSKV